jgi:cytochrome oxidase Cu insertion factor (SCO1/SenC/PrrC family)
LLYLKQILTFNAEATTLTGNKNKIQAKDMKMFVSYEEITRRNKIRNYIFNVAL